MKTSLKLGLLTAALGLPLSASAADPLEDGTRFTMSIGMGNAPTMERQPSPFNTLLPPVPSGPMMSNRIGVALGSVVAFGTVGVYAGGTHFDGETVKTRVLVPGAGLRYHFRPMAPKKASPYVVASAYTKMLQSDLDPDIDKELEKVKRRGFTAGFGGEYAFSGAFSVAGEAGIAHDAAKYEDGDMVWMQVSTAVTSSVLLNFYF